MSDSHRTIEPSVLYLGTPAFLVATVNPDGSPNLAPASSHFALDRMIVIGLEEGGQSLHNVRRTPEITVNFPAAHQWAHVERLAGVTGKDPVPSEKAGSYRFEPRKFEHAGVTPIPAAEVQPPRVAEFPIQLEARVKRVTDGVQGVYGIVEAEVVRVHAAPEITIPDSDHIDPHAWRPLIYLYRHFFDLGTEVGWTRKTPFDRTPEQIERWEAHGGTWRISARTQTSATIELLRCDGGEVVETIVSDDPETVRWALAEEVTRS